MFMDYNLDFIVTKAYFDKLEITNIINKYNQKKHDITGKISTVGLQVYYFTGVLCVADTLYKYSTSQPVGWNIWARGMSYLLYHTNKQWMPDIGEPISSSIPWGVQSQS